MGIDFQYLLGMINDSFMSSPTSIVVNGGKMGFRNGTNSHSNNS